MYLSKRHDDSPEKDRAEGEEAAENAEEIFAAAEEEARDAQDELIKAAEIAEMAEKALKDKQDNAEVWLGSMSLLVYDYQDPDLHFQINSDREDSANRGSQQLIFC